MRHYKNLGEVEAALEPFYPSRLTRLVYTTEHIQQFMESIGNPQEIPKPIHIAGTSGKTSTAYYAAALLKQAGKRTGLLVSPHAETLNERVQIDMEPLDERVFCDEFAVFMDLVAKSGLTLSRAELLYGFGFWEFARQRVEYIVVEVGMGGLLDATNVINREDKTCLITDIGMDHTNVLGETITEIAEHKAGIIRLHNHVFCHRQADDILRVIRSRSKQQQADLHILEDATVDVDVSFLPLFQRRNFALARAAVTFLLGRAGAALPDDSQTLAAARTKIPSRMEMLEADGKTIILDGAHNPQKLRALADSVRDLFPGQDIVLLTAFTGGRGRNTDELAEQLASLRPKRVIVTSVRQVIGPERYASPEEVAASFKKAGIEADVAPDQARAYHAAATGQEPILLVTGSIYLLGELKPVIKR